MTTNELKILEIIWNWGGEASVDIIAREAKISIDYARLICKSLDKEGYIDFLHSKLCKIKSKPPHQKFGGGGKGKLAVATRQSQDFKKIVIPQKPGKFGLGKNKKGRLLLSY
ncbi:MAG: hypothetical protein ABIJ05_02405 [Patescibacteria group bacterium]